MKQSNFPFPKDKPRVGDLNRLQTATFEHAVMVQDFEAQGVRVMHIFNKHRPRGGFTVAYRPCSNFKSTKMVECAVSTCSAEDTFNKRIGTKIALSNFGNGKTIDLPILAVYCANDITFAIKACFIAIHNEIGPGLITPY
jgi:hypothetical protein